MASFSIDGLIELVNKYHDPTLIKTKIAPNANKIYHIYNDGEITCQKGGDAYGQRTEFTEYGNILSKIDMIHFPIPKSYSYGYAIVTLEHALEIRCYMSGLKSME